MIPVLDQGFVRLVAYMQPVPLEVVGYSDEEYKEVPSAWTGDLEIIRNARVSHDADWRQDDSIIHEAACVSLLPPMSTGEIRSCNCTPRTVSDKRLMNYLYKNQHSTPFEAMVFTFEVKAPIFVIRQWHRHRTWSYNEVSARYTELPEDFYVPAREHIGKQDPKNRQGRNVFDSEIDDYVEKDRQQRIVESFHIAGNTGFKSYHDMLGEGVPRELARLNLPLSTYTRMFGTVNLWNLFRFLHLRDHEHAQWEIRQYAKALKELVRPIVPNAMAAFDRYATVTVDTQASCLVVGENTKVDTETQKP